VDEIIQLANKYPQLHFALYTKKAGKPKPLPRNLAEKPLSRESFIEDMSHSSAVICTAGFETLCEAIVRAKQLFIIPSTGHFEQLCNAREATAKGLARNISDFNGRISQNPAIPPAITHWYSQSEQIILSIICE
jgi:uncharacterized protein (TIGR00661 family)